MPHYISLINWTDQGIRNVKGGPQRIANARKAVEAAGGKWHSLYLTMGQYDLVVITEFPNDEAAATFTLTLGAQGNVRTTTLKAFTEEETIKIINNIPSS